MIWIALKMLTGDTAKYYGIVFGVTFASVLMAQQVSIFVGIMGRTTSQIRDVREVDAWVMDPDVRYPEEIIPLSETDLQRVRGVAGVEWAVRFFKGTIRTRLAEGNVPDSQSGFRSVVMLGVDDATLVGAPREMIMGNLEDIKRPDAVIIDECGYTYLWPGQAHRIGQTLECNDHRAVVVGICKASPPFQAQAVVYTRYSQAMLFAPPERRQTSFVLVKAAEGQDHKELCTRIKEKTGLKALTVSEFEWATILFYLASTGIGVNFGVTVMLGFVVGIAIAGQTLYLFTIENLKQFGALKAMGTSNPRIVLMIMVQAGIVGLLGYGIGMGMAALFFETLKDVVALKGFKMIPEVMAGTAVAVTFIITVASLLSIRKVLVLEPAVVFR